MHIVVILAVLSALAACSPSSGTGRAEADNETPGAATDNETPGTVADNGQTGSAGYACIESECASKGQELLESFARARSPAYSASECQPGLAPGQIVTIEQRFSVPHCRCRDQDGTWQDGPVPGLPGCSVRGRGGVCLWDGPVPTCDPGDPRTCESTCAEVEHRRAEDAAADFEAQARFAHCVNPSCVSPDCWSRRDIYLRCGVVIEVNGQCHGTDSAGFLSATPRDCAASDQEILFPSADSAALATEQDGAVEAGASDAGSAAD